MSTTVRPEDVRYAYEAMAPFLVEGGAAWQNWLERNRPAFWKALLGEMAKAAHEACADENGFRLEHANARKLLAFVFAAVFSARGKSFPELSGEKAMDNLQEQTVGKVVGRTNEVVQRMWKMNQRWTEAFLDMQKTFKLNVRSLIVLYAFIKTLFDELSRQEAVEQSSTVKPQGV